jgi:N-acetylglucosamine malate deacetylase 1
MRILVVAPHPDDETLGVGGALLRYRNEGHSIGWLIVTDVPADYGWSVEQYKNRESQISQVSDALGFEKVYRLKMPSTKLDTIPSAEIISKIREVVVDFEPTDIFIPHHGDAHTDHYIANKATLSCAKSFRAKCVERVLAYETLSETEFGVYPESSFTPNTFVDISGFLNEKLRVLGVYESEMGEFPFPRSNEAITALARLRGSTGGFQAAEAFQLLRQYDPIKA